MSTPNRSRRERPAKPALSREGIIAATIEIVRAEGLEKATMRRVAQALETGPSALYVYVANTAELHGGVLDELIRSVDIASEGDWQDRLVALLRDYADVLFAFPGLARSALVLRPSGPNLLRIFDRVLGLLIDGGVDPARAAWGADLLLQNATRLPPSTALPVRVISMRQSMTRLHGKVLCWRFAPPMPRSFPVSQRTPTRFSAVHPPSV